MRKTAKITVPLTDREQKVLLELAQKQDLSPARVMIQGLRLYQLVTVGGAKVTMPDDLPMKSTAQIMDEDS